MPPPFFTTLPPPLFGQRAWADRGGGHPMADNNLQADVLREKGGGGTPLLCIFWRFYDDRSFIPIVEV